ncbi:MAG: VIT1/CCC1 transporter family protein [Candidatus Micrarchaeota archaeon]
MLSKEVYIQSLQQDEDFHAQVYNILSQREKNQNVKNVLLRLYKIEVLHSSILKSILKINGFKVRKRNNTLRILLILISRKVFGIAFTMKLMEYNKIITNEKLNVAMKQFSFSIKEEELLKKMVRGERAEDALGNMLLSMNDVLTNIRDVVFGMNDGLVEVLAATVGFSAALRSPTLVLIAGLLVAISGALSMSSGAYLSTKYERDIGNTKVKRSPHLSALWTGIAYLLGAFFPILPFALGVSGAYGIVFSILSTILVLAIASSMIAILSDQSVAKRVIESIILSLGAASVTILLGFYARYALHIAI